MNTSPTTEDRIWAVLSHLSSLAFGMGSLLPIIGWSEQRRKSKYATFQCLQALGYQSLGYTVWLLSYLLAIILLLILLVIAASTTSKVSGSGNALVGFWTSFLILIVGFFAFYFLLPVVAAIACALGKDFRYPILGNRLAKYLGYQQADTDSAWLIEEHEDHWVAAMGHFSVIIALWGMLLPVTAWIVRGKRSFFLKFQSIQTTVYQAFVNLISMGAGFVYFIGVIIFFALTGLEGSPNQSSPTGMVGLFIFGLTFLFASIVLLIVPLFHIMGQWAGYRVLRGDNYHYPFLGKMVEKRIADKTTAPAQGGLSPKGELQ